jgi:T-complex protein 11
MPPPVGNTEAEPLHNGGKAIGYLTSATSPINDPNYKPASTPNDIPSPLYKTPPQSRCITPCPTPTKQQVSIEFIFGCLKNIGASPRITDQYALFVSAPIDPPITKHVLKCLDIPSMVNSLTLRWDINFTRELAYRKLESPESELENSSSKLYYSSVRLEFELYALLPDILASVKNLPGIERHDFLVAMQRRLPRLLKAIKEVLQTIVPKKELVDLDQLFDERLMLQEIPQGCCDFPLIASRLAELLIRHCAPIRDQRIREMAVLFCKGGFESITKGLEELLTILELMRLDTSNHLLRSFRWHFIDATPTFGVRYFGHRIVKGRFNARPSRVWFLRNHKQFAKKPEAREGVSRHAPLRAFVEAFTRHVLPCCVEKLPDTFDMDAQRIQTTRSEILEIIHLRVCYWVFRYVYRLCGKLQALPCNVQRDIQREMQLIARGSGSVHSDLPNLAVYIVRKALDCSGNEDKPLDTQLVERARGYLEKGFNPNRIFFSTEEKKLQKALAEDVFRIADANLNAPPWEIFDKLVPVTSNNQRPGLASPRGEVLPAEEQQLREITNRVAHMALLNWTVFAELIYLNDDICDPDCMDLMPHKNKTESLSDEIQGEPSNAAGHSDQTDSKTRKHVLPEEAIDKQSPTPHPERLWTPQVVNLPIHSGAYNTERQISNQNRGKSTGSDSPSKNCNNR